jgi:hypothetical protein
MDYPKTEAGLRARIEYTGSALRARIEALTTLMRNEREEREREREERKRERELLLAKLSELYND